MPLLPMTPAPIFGNKGVPVLDAQLSVFLAGTTTPAPIYTAPDLANRYDNPLPVNGYGVISPVYAPAGTYRLRATDGFGLVLFDVDGIVVIDPGSSGGGGGGTGTTIPTGAIMDMYRTGTVSGWVRQNGRTIGSSASSATERANDDTNALFLHLWGQDPNLAVSGGRGANAASDWSANKTLALPDQRGRARLALDDMGASAAGRLVGGYFMFGGATTLGSYGGEPATLLITAQLPIFTPSAYSAYTDAQGGHNHTGTSDAEGQPHLHPIQYGQFGAAGGGNQINVLGGGSQFNTNSENVTHTHTFTTSSVGNHAHSVTVNFNSIGSGQSHNTLPPFLLTTAYIKL